MEEKKFLDANGLRVLWDKILEEDYTNNSILTAVINAIDEAKADKEEVPSIDPTLTQEGAAADAKAVGEALLQQPDWFQEDVSAIDYIKNRPMISNKVYDITIPAGEPGSFVLLYDFYGAPEYYTHFNAHNLFVPMWGELQDMEPDAFFTNQMSILYVGIDFVTSRGYRDHSGYYPCTRTPGSDVQMLDDKNYTLTLAGTNTVYYFIFDTTLLNPELQSVLTAEGIYVHITNDNVELKAERVMLHELQVYKTLDDWFLSPTIARVADIQNNIDNTLTQANKSADAKAVGDAIANIELTPGPKGDSGVYVGAEEPTDDSVNVWVNPNANPLESILSQLYFKPGDNITTRFWTAGTLTNQGKNVHFAIPLDRPMIGVSSLRLEGAKAQIRQNDIYLLGNRDSGSWDEPYGVRLALVNTQGQPNYPLVCTIDFETMPEGATNNDAVGIAFEGTIYFE